MDVPGLWPAAPPAPAGDEAPAGSSRTWLRRIIASPRTIDEAHEAIGWGAAAGYIFAGMYVLGGVISYTSGYDLARQEKIGAEDAIDRLIGFMLLAALIAGLSYRFRKKGNILIPAVLGLWFATEVVVKLATQPRLSIGWLVAYGCLAAGFVSGVRGAFFIRRKRKVDEGEARQNAAAMPAGTAGEVHPIRETRKANFIVRHWRGELPLPVSYWVLGFALNIVLFGLIALLGEAAGSWDLPPGSVGAALLGFFGTLLLITVWQVVGIWRSAGAHSRKTGRATWGTLARIAVTLGLVQFGAQMNTLWPVVKYSWKLTYAGDDTPPFHLRLLREGTEVELSGGMSTGTADALKSILDAAPKIKVVHLNSIGGLMAEGYKLNKLFAERK